VSEAIDPAAIKTAFDTTADAYDRARRQLVPCFDEFYRVAVAQLSLASAGTPNPPSSVPIEVLDLGAGTGLLAAFVAAAYPLARITLVDMAPAMLMRARERFAAQSDRVRFAVADYARMPLEGRYDAIVSALSIHHLEHERKRELFRRVHGALKPGGVFVNADQVAGATPALERRNRESWLKRTRVLGVTEADLAAALERMQLDRTAPVAQQLQWLRAAGLVEVKCAFNDQMFAVFRALRSC
jgi:tRNA (cmo5U34)-methyltransferase